MQNETNEVKPNSNLLVLVAMLLTFILILVFIWRWYDLKNTSLEKEKPPTTEYSGN